MKITVACDKYKGTLEAQEVCNIIKSAFKMVLPDSRISTYPIADGGEGSLDILL